MAVRASETITIFHVIDVDSTTIYYLLQSSTANPPAKPTTDNPGGNWSTTEPTYTEGSTNTLYTVTKTKYSDGSFEYTPVSKSSSYEAAKVAYNKAYNAENAVNNLEIGARNLLLQTNQGLTRWSRSCQNGTIVLEEYVEDNINGVIFRCTEAGTGWYFYTYKINDIFDRILSGQKYTISFEYKTNANADNFQVMIKNNDGTNRKDTGNGVVVIIGDEEWHKAYISFLTNDTELVSQNIFFGNCGTPLRTLNSYIAIRNLKLEKGTIPTDWTPAPEDIEALTSEVIVGTQTATTASWVGKASFNKLVDKQQIAYWLPTTSASNATLDLTLADGTTTGAVPLYYQGTTRIGTHYPAGSVVHLTYRENVTIGSTTIAKGWWGDANYDTNNYDRIRFNNSIKAKTAISASRLIVGDDSGFFHLLAGVVFDIDKPILWSNAAIAANATGSDNYIARQSCTMRNNTNSSWTATQYKTLYLVGILNGNTFTVDSTTPFTTTVPSADDGKYYISLGYMYSTYQIYLYPEHPIFKYVNGQFKNLNQVAYEAQYKISNLQIGGRNLALHSKTFEKILDGTASVTTSSKAVELSSLFTKENYAGKEITISWYGEASDLVLNDFGRHRYGVELSFPRTGGGTTYIGAWKETHEDWSGRVSVTGKIPEDWTGTIGAHHAYIQGFDVGSKVKIFKIKIESGNMMTDWTEAPEDSGSITKSPTAPADITSVWFNTNDSMFYVYDNNSDSPTYQTWVIINDISGSFDEINRKFNQDIPNSIAQAIANNNIELANVYYTKEQVDAQLEIKDGQIRQTFSDWVTRVENTANGVNEIVTDLSGYINTGTENGSTYLELGNVSSQFKVKIENSRMAILYMGQEVTSWDQDLFKVETVISRMLHLGKFGFIVNDDDSISFRKIDQ